MIFKQEAMNPGKEGFQMTCAQSWLPGFLLKILSCQRQLTVLAINSQNWEDWEPGFHFGRSHNDFDRWGCNRIGRRSRPKGRPLLRSG
jgi:hypothetical protein